MIFPIGDQNEPGGRRAPVTLLIILANFAVFLLLQLPESGKERQPITYGYSTIPYEITHNVDLVGPKRGNPEVEWEVDPVAAGRIGLTVEQISSQLSAAWLGEVPTELHLLDRSVPTIRKRLRAYAVHGACVPRR